MIFWVFALALTAGALYAVARPLLRQAEDRSAETDTADYDVAVFKSQLRELERDLSLGRITAEEAEASKLEVSRRLLAADKRRQQADQPSRIDALWPRLISAIVLSGGIAAAVLLYFESGDPNNPDMPLVLRQAELQMAQNPTGGTGAPDHQAEDGEAGNLDDMALRLRARLDSGEGGPEDWSLLGRTEMMRGNYKLAADAYAEALREFPDDSALNSAYGEALVFWADGLVTDQAMAVFMKVIQLTPNDPRGHFYLAEYDRQAGRLQDALDRWISLLNSAGPDAPWTEIVRERIDALAADMGVDVSDRLTGPVGPSAEEMAAAGEMSPEDRQEMIRGMVDGLAERLAQDPSDFDGWMRLIRSRMVLGERDAAQADLAAAMAQFANAPFPMRELAALAEELGLQATAADDTPPGPTAEDMAAAQDMEPEDRQAMIEGMVEGLAARLQDDPTDLQGWTMLARSYGVLGRYQDAVHAFTRASQLSPGDTDLILERARILRTLAGEQQTEETVALMIQVEKIEPDNIEALWFLGLDAYRRQDLDAAKSYFDRAMNAFPADSPERASLQAEIDRMFATQAPE